MTPGRSGTCSTMLKRRSRCCATPAPTSLSRVANCTFLPAAPRDHWRGGQPRLRGRAGQPPGDPVGRNHRYAKPGHPRIRPGGCRVGPGYGCHRPSRAGRTVDRDPRESIVAGPRARLSTRGVHIGCDPGVGDRIRDARRRVRRSWRANNLSLVGKLQGHRRRLTTTGYAEFSDAQMVAAAESARSIIARATAGASFAPDRDDARGEDRLPRLPYLQSRSDVVQIRFERRRVLSGPKTRFGLNACGPETACQVRARENKVKPRGPLVSATTTVPRHFIGVGMRLAVEIDETKTLQVRQSTL